MSEHEQPVSDDDAILDANIERLLSDTQQRSQVPAEARTRMLARLREQVGEVAKRQPKPRHTPARAATSTSSTTAGSRGARARVALVTSVVAIAAVLLLAWLLGVPARLLSEREADDIARFEHDGLGARAVALADGSTAVLRSGAALEQLGPRHLRLVAGEVLLDVRAAADPLLVETPHGRALVLGTRVLLRSDAAQTLAAVLRGEASLEPLAEAPNEPAAATSLLLHAGEQALMTASTVPERIAGRRLSFEIDWARELLTPAPETGPMRRGNLLARVPRWTGQLQRSAEWPLPVRELIVDVHVEHGHVRTTIDQTFFNHLDRDLEGVYQFPLPPEAAISRLAMYVDGQRMEAGVVARDRGREIYEQIVHRRRDPALLEWMQGNLFQVRIFPLPGRTEKRVLLSYTAALDELYDRGELRVPIPELDLPVGRVRYRIRVVGGAGREFEARNHEFQVREDGQDLIAEFSAVDHRIGADIVASLAGPVGREVELHRLRHADGRRHVGVRLRPDLRRELDQTSTSAPARDWIVLFDGSASREPAQLDAQRRFVDGLLDNLDGGDRLALLRFDTAMQWAHDSVEPVATLDRTALRNFLAAAKVGIGATDLDGAVEAALARLAETPALERDNRERIPTLLVLGDGLAQDLSATDTRGDDLAARIHGRANFVAVSFGPAYDAPALERLAAAGAGLHVHVAEGDAVEWKALELLTTLTTVRVLELDARLLDAEGNTIAADRSHADAQSLADGESLELLAELRADDPDPVAVELRGRAGDASWQRRFELPSATTDDARWLPRAWAQAHVAALTESGVEAHADEITALGLAHFLVTPTTSLLVLENEEMYRDFDVHRPSPDAWAAYDAPERIEVVREGKLAIAGHGQYVVRTPVEMLSESGASWAVRTRGWGPMVQVAAAEPFGFGGLGLIGTGRGGGGSGFGFGLEGTIGLGSSGLIGKGGGGGSEAGFAGRGGPRRPSAETSSPKADAFGGFVRREAGPLSWGSNRQQARVDDLADRRSADTKFASTVVTGAFHAHASAYSTSMPWPVARHYAGDPRLDDIGELVPALFEEPFDLAREQLLLTGLDGSRGSIQPDAAELIAAARAAQANMRFELPEGGTLDIDGDGRFEVLSRRWGFLDERVRYDGEQLRADYPELGVSVVRAVGPTSPALLGAWVPWLVPPADHLAHFYVVERHGALGLKLTPIGETKRWLEVELDAAHRVVALRMHAGARETSSQTFRWDDDALTLIDGEHERVLRRVGASQGHQARAAEATRVDLPLASPADLALALDDHTPGDAEWIALQHQRLAGLAALGSTQEQVAVLEALLDHAGRVLPGELVLGGAALRWADAKLRARVLSACDDPIADYLAARTSNRGAPLAKLAARDDLRGTVVGFLASYDMLLREAGRAPSEAVMRKLDAFLHDYAHPSHAYVATYQLSYGWWRSSERKARTWLALAEQDNRYKYVALHQAGVAHYQYGRNREAAELFERSFREAAADETLPIIDYSVQWALTQAVGEAGWQLAWTRLRERVAKSGDAELALRFLAMAAQLGRLDDAERVIASLDAVHMDAELALALFDGLMAHGRVGEAVMVLGTLREREDLRDAAPVLLRASLLAEQQGRLDDAALALEQALARMLDGDGLSLDDLRASFTRLLELRSRLAQPLALGGEQATERDAALARALAVADRWRVEDPDNPEIDRLCAQLLWSLDRPDEAWRQLASVIDRHGAEGEALAWVADALERGGDLQRADQVWARAIAVEPTDPLHRLRRAQNLIASGDETQARQLLAQIVDGDWQPRFSFVVAQAKNLLK